ncbi:MAG: leucine-rich repeat domain-containing protein, partial [Treponema sp.]|nr:leucine-rich repeat domain-containing protein [Treponema sp.]
PNSVTSIGDSAFGYCFELTSVTFGRSGIDISLAGFQSNLSRAYIDSGEGTYSRNTVTNVWSKQP